MAEARFDQSEQRVGDDGQPGAGDASGQHQRPVLRLQSGEDRITEARLADGRGKRRCADGPHRCGANARHDVGRGERRLDDPQSLPETHAYGVRRLEHAGIEVGLRCHRVAQDRQQRIERQREQRGQEAERRQVGAEYCAQGQQDREEQRQQGQRRDRLHEAGEAQRAARYRLAAARPHRQRQGDGGAEPDRAGGQDDVLRQHIAQPEQRGPHRAHASSSFIRCA